jgi:integral membrane sensor domain MASE1
MTIKPDCPYRRADLPWLALTAVVLALLGRIVLDFFAASGMTTIFWPGAGVALAAVLLGGRKIWPAILLGTLTGSLWAGQRPDVAALMALGSTAEALLGAWLLTRKADFDTALGASRDFVRLCGLAGALSPLVCALICADTLLLAGVIAPDAAWREFVQHWMGDLLGIVIVAPLILVWRQLPRRQQIAWPEGLALIATAFLVGQIVFLDWFHGLFGLINQGYWMYLIVSWAAVRLGMHGVVAVLLMATVQALAGAAAGLGFFGNDQVMTQLTNLWAYTMTLALVGIALAISFAERGRISAELGKLSLAVAQSPVSIIITGLDGRIEYVNPAFTVVSGYATDEIRVVRIRDQKTD